MTSLIGLWRGYRASATWPEYAQYCKSRRTARIWRQDALRRFLDAFMQGAGLTAGAAFVLIVLGILRVIFLAVL